MNEPIAAAQGGLLVGDTRGHSSVFTRHGRIGWKLLARRSQMVSWWETFEWYSLDPSGFSSERLNSRTEALCFLLSGTGEAVLNGASRLVGAGDLVLTGVGASHGLRNTSGRRAVEWLSIDMQSPATAAVFEEGVPALMDEPTTTGGVQVPATGRASIFDLRDPAEVDPSSVLDGPLRRIRRIRLDRDESIRLEARENEYATFALSGTGQVRTESTVLTLTAGTAVTLPLGSRAEFVAEQTPVDLFVATMAVPKFEARP